MNLDPTGATQLKIVVFGSGGMIGSRIAAELGQLGHDLTGASCSTGADITDAACVARIATGADAIVNAISARGADDTLADVARSLSDGAGRAVSPEAWAAYAIKRASPRLAGFVARKISDWTR